MKLDVMVLSIGIVNITSGKTMYDWSIYDHPNSKVYLTNHGSLLLASSTTFDDCDGAELTLIGNDSNKKVRSDVAIIDSAFCVLEEVLVMLKKHKYDYYPMPAFKSRARDNKKLITSHSVKGVSVYEPPVKKKRASKA